MLLELRKDHVALARAEAERLSGIRGLLDGHLLLLDAPLPKGLALTRAAYEVLGTGDTIEEAMGLDWRRIIRGSFALRAPGLDEAALAATIWRALDEPRVDLQHPDDTIRLFRGRRLYATRLAWRNEEPFEERRSHRRAQNHPTSLDPRLARAMINLAGPVQRIIDPFCGAGGILIEGALAGRSMTGVDIDERQVRRARENAAALGAAVEAIQGDARTVPGGYDAVVTDVPLGRNARLDSASVVRDFAQRCLAPRVVVGCEDPAPFAHWRLVARFEWYVHRSFKKQVLLLGE